ncbi:MAG: hypothetical protein NVS1B1_11410 [Candidatus Limnocylindrales bacterium]
MLTVVWTDWRSRRIPNVVTYPAMLVGVGFGLAESVLGSSGFPGSPFAGGLLDHLAGIVVGFLVSYPFYAGGGLKAGDGKLLMAVGGLKGTAFLLQAAVWGALAGGVIAIVFIVLRRLTRPAPGEAPNTMHAIMKTWIPYGVALGLGALIALAFQLRPIS